MGILVSGKSFNQAFYSHFQKCDVTCGQGVHSAKRSCKDLKTDEIVKNPRNLCEGEASRTKECANLRQCPEWSFWQDWTNCPVTCRDPMGLRASQGMFFFELTCNLNFVSRIIIFF